MVMKSHEEEFPGIEQESKQWWQQQSMSWERYVKKRKNLRMEQNSPFQPMSQLQSRGWSQDPLWHPGMVAQSEQFSPRKPNRHLLSSRQSCNICQERQGLFSRAYNSFSLAFSRVLTVTILGMTSNLACCCVVVHSISMVISMDVSLETFTNIAIELTFVTEHACPSFFASTLERFNAVSMNTSRHPSTGLTWLSW